MPRYTPSQLDKVLALADSNHDGEAVVAVRKARQMLSKDGLSFGDLARIASQKSRLHFPFGLFSGQQAAGLEMEILHLRRQIEELRREVAAAEGRTDNWQQRAQELEKKLNQSQSETSRWQHLARETVEKLWDLSQSMQDELPDEQTNSPPACGRG